MRKDTVIDAVVLRENRFKERAVQQPKKRMQNDSEDFKTPFKIAMKNSSCGRQQNSWINNKINKTKTILASSYVRGKLNLNYYCYFTSVPVQMSSFKKFEGE